MINDSKINDSKNFFMNSAISLAGLNCIWQIEYN